MQLIKEIMAEWGMATEEARRSALQLLRQNAEPGEGASEHSSECPDQPEPGGEGILQSRG